MFLAVGYGIVPFMVETKGEIKIGEIKSGDRTPEEVITTIKTIVGKQTSPERLLSAIGIATGLGIARLEGTKAQKLKTSNNK